MDLLRALKNELTFLDRHGYGERFRSSWRPALLFLDSPICMNFKPGDPLRPCSACTLFQLVPQESRDAFRPCHHIPLNESAETVAKLYRRGTQQKLDATYREWLVSAIQELEKRE